MNNQPTFLSRGLDIVLSLLFFIIPLSYAWMYIPWRSITLVEKLKSITGNLCEPMEYVSLCSWRIGNIITLFFYNFTWFERVKVLFFLGLITLATLFFLGTKRLTKNHLILLGIFFGWSILSYLVNQDVNPYFWFGNMEKFHGWYLYLSIFVLGIILSTNSHQENKKYLKASILSWGFVCLYALFQYMGWDPLTTSYSTRLDLSRIFSTLWNPNYLAGYTLMLLPLVGEKVFSKTDKKYSLWYGILLVGLLLTLIGTKSLIGFGVLIGYTFYLLLYKYLPLNQKIRHALLLTAIGIVIIISGYILTKYGNQMLEIQRIKGFIARYFLWETGLKALFGDIKNALFGYGPDGFLPISELFRSRELAIFEDSAFRIDRSHNAWIDIFLHFGIPLGGFIIYSIFSPWKQLPLSHKETLVLFSIFFFFNIPVLVHFMLLLQILILTKNPEKITLPLRH